MKSRYTHMPSNVIPQALAFTDTVNHWAEDDIDFMTMRGLLSRKVNDAGGGKEAPLGYTGNNLFSPDMPVTRERWR